MPGLMELPLDLTEDEARLMLAIQLFQEGRISLGKAAEIAGYSLRAFSEILTHRNVPLVSYSAEDLRHDLDHA